MELQRRRAAALESALFLRSSFLAPIVFDQVRLDRMTLFVEEKLLSVPLALGKIEHRDELAPSPHENGIAVIGDGKSGQV